MWLHFRSGFECLRWPSVSMGRSSGQLRTMLLAHALWLPSRESQAPLHRPRQQQTQPVGLAQKGARPVGAPDPPWLCVPIEPPHSHTLATKCTVGCARPGHPKLLWRHFTVLGLIARAPCTECPTTRPCPPVSHFPRLPPQSRGARRGLGEGTPESTATPIQTALPTTQSPHGGRYP
jgi:hypothetical protein